MSNNVVRIYADGVYDLFHYGHVRFLKKAKYAFPNVELLVGVCNDHDAIIYKREPIFSHEERIESVCGCKYVDRVLTDAPWILTPSYLSKYNIDFVAHNGIPYQCHDVDDLYALLYKTKQSLIIPRSHGISTSDIIYRCNQK
jgi:cytidyltransferase-like protein